MAVLLRTRDVLETKIEAHLKTTTLRNVQWPWYCYHGDLE